jgi:hypothetical protein
MTRPYRPSNGTEGECFMDAFCFNGCKHETEERPCKILGATMAYDITHPNYPKEWVCEDDLSRPRCTAFQLDGEPDKVPRCDKTKDMFE